MDFFNQERKLFTDPLKTVVPKLSSPFENIEAKPAQTGQSQKVEETKRGTLIFTNRASLFSPPELSDFFEQTATLIHREKRYGRLQTPEAVQGHFEAGRAVIGVADYQVWGYASLIQLHQNIGILETVIREDFRNTEAAKRLVDLFARRDPDPKRTFYALSWTPYTKRLFRELAWVPCQPKALDTDILETLKTYDEDVERYDLFRR
jgi:hypothetical protein